MIVGSIQEDNTFGTIKKFVEDHHKPNGINGKYFVDFTASLSDVDFDELDLEICLGLAKCNLDKYPMVNGVIPEKIQVKELAGEFESNALFNYSSNREHLLGLDIQQRRKFLFFRKKSLIPWFFILDLKPNLFKTKSQDLYPWADCIKLFPKLKDCILKLPFIEIGRVVIYGSWPESRVPCHRDSYPSNDYDHHINFNPGGYRPVYVYDSINDIKHYLPDNYKFYAYNTSDYHGVDPLPYFSYTVRVDGIFK